jgi:hypothetical protein
MSNTNICASINKQNETLTNVVRDISSLTNTISNIKHSIELLSIKIDQVINSSLTGVAVHGTAGSVKVSPPSVPVKKLSLKECEEKISDLVLTLKEILRRFPVIEKIS